MPDIESSHIRVPESIDQAPTALTTAARQLQDELDSLATKLAPLHEQWIGPDNVAYSDVQQLWQKDATALFDPEFGVLGQIAQAVRAVADNYHHTRDYNVRTWRAF
jgi:WXG100 family type VII secretion target